MTDSTHLQDGRIQANGIEQHYLRYGGPAGARAQRDTVIVVPGNDRPAASWSRVGERFGRHFDTYVLAPREAALDQQAADLNAFAAALGLAHWAVVGHAAGARAALRAAVARPAGLNRLALVDPPHLQREELEAELPRLAVPVLLVTAERGELSEDEVFEMEIAMPGLTEVRVAGSGPLAPWNGEEPFFQAFGAFLGAHLDP